MREVRMAESDTDGGVGSVSWVYETALVKATELRLGNLDAKRDWGFAGDYVDAMWRMLQLDEPDDFVICTGETRTVREFCDKAFSRVGLDADEHIVIDEKFYRPAEVDLLVGDRAKAESILGWRPTVDFTGLVEMMVDADMALVERRLRQGS